MTDKELAEKYANTVKCEWENDTYYVDCRDNVEEAFIAGLKVARKAMWHDLKKDPSDLPEPYATVLDEEGNRITYQGGGKWTFYSDYYEMDIDAISPVAWCEIPTFEEYNG